MVSTSDLFLFFFLTMLFIQERCSSLMWWVLSSL
jgi:hypothetical protein